MAEVSGYVLINGDRNVYHAHKAISFPAASEQR